MTVSPRLPPRSATADAGRARRPDRRRHVVRRAHAVIVERFAARLDLPSRAAAGHTQRGTTAAIAGAWGLAAAAVAKVGLDIVLLAQSDVGELSEVAEGAGGSSSMPHKHNPIAAICARAAAMQAPGAVATLLHAAGSHELERAAGAWHAEWPALQVLLRSTGSAVDWLQTSVRRLVVTPSGWREPGEEPRACT